ncbi:DNA internalization-related competence protein ComEC/Rec2 [Desulfolucanica intricata]|uniref:DNA internalization-related competence protein ComEC/Rec2 n=1 Tax=Desulfolucanica intricata TaxID=1285191 RepID=UPI00082D5CAC|nr:DNA internalization-related competence protein ComEC/Rec2 [Desulfolucanica intricata]
MNRPLVIIVFFYTVGILAGTFLPVVTIVPLVLSIGLFLTSLVGYKLAWRQNRWVIFLLFLCLGCLMCRLSIDSINTSLNNYAGHYVTLEGIVVREPDRRENRVIYVLKVQESTLGNETENVSGLVQVTVWEPKYIYGYGDCLQVKGRLDLPDEPGNPGEFNYRQYLARQGIGLMLSVNSDQGINYIGIGKINPVINLALTVKNNLLNVTEKTLSEDHAALVKGILFGNCGQIKSGITEAFQQTGLIHVLSVSGLHVGIVLGGVLVLLRGFNLAQRLTLPVAGSVLVLYTIMTGLSPPALRATIMALILLLAHHLGRRRDWPTALALAALVILIYQPLNLYNPGVQLSFAATWGILYLNPRLTNIFQEKLKIKKLWAQVFAVPLAAQLTTMPLVAWHFNIISPVALIANIIVVPLVDVIVLLACLGVITGLVTLWMGEIFNAATAALLDIFMELVTFFHHLPAAFIYVASPTVSFIIIWYLLIILLVNEGWRNLVKNHVIDKPMLSAIIFLTILGSIFIGEPKQQLTVHFIDVGQGDSALIQTPAGKNILIDTGGRPEELQTGSGVGDRVVLPYLRRLGVRKLDVLILTHPHEDHIGGAAAVIKGLPVNMVLIPPQEKKLEQGYRNLLNFIEFRDVPVQTATAGDRLNVDPRVKIEVLSPVEDMVGINNDSLVLRVTFGEEDFLFTGDIEKEAQSFLLQQNYNLSSEVLKVTHHGSKNCLPELLEKVKPEIAVISVGRNNFGHPAVETLENLKSVGAVIYRTDQNGAVIIKTNGKRLRISTTY